MAIDFVRPGAISQKAPNAPPVPPSSLQKPNDPCHIGPDRTICHLQKEQITQEDVELTKHDQANS